MEEDKIRENEDNFFCITTKRKSYIYRYKMQPKVYNSRVTIS